MERLLSNNMKLYIDLINKGYYLENVNHKDFDAYYQIKKENSIKYVTQFFNGWDEENQIEYNKKTFEESFIQTFFSKIIKDNKIIGFLGYTVFDDCIGCVTLQIKECFDRIELMTWYLEELIRLSNKYKLPINMKVFINNPDIEIFTNLGFYIQNTNKSHYLITKH